MKTHMNVTFDDFLFLMGLSTHAVSVNYDKLRFTLKQQFNGNFWKPIGSSHDMPLDKFWHTL